MKTPARLLSAFALLTTIDAAGRAQQADWEAEVRQAEAQHREAFLAADAEALDAMLADDFLVNSPRGTVVDKQELLELVRNGELTLSVFEQQIEQVRRYEGFVVVMGADSVTYAKPSPAAGVTHRRRFTDVWRHDERGWRFTARQANIICP